MKVTAEITSHNIDVANRGIKIEICDNAGRAFGRLIVNVVGVAWKGRNAKKASRISWEKFQSLFEEFQRLSRNKTML